MRTTNAFVLLALLAAGASAGACKKTPTPGEACSNDNEAVCKDPTTFLSCSGGKWEQVACRGPDGCQTQGAVVKCDETLAQEGDPCGGQKSDHYSCTVDKKAQLKCSEGKWKLAAKCAGPKACELQGLFVKCDQSIATEGEPCEVQKGDKSFACTADKKAELECSDGKWKLASKCQGTKGCEVQGLFVKCDTSVATEGDPCTKAGDAACSSDGKAILQCKDGKYSVDEPCRVGRCTVDGMFIKCK